MRQDFAHSRNPGQTRPHPKESEMLIRKLLVAGLVMSFALVASLPEAQARHCRRIRCCNQGVLYGGGYQINNASFTSPQPQGFQVNGQGVQGYQDGQYQSGYQPNGIAVPNPQFRDAPMNNDPNTRVQTQPDRNVQSQQNLRVHPAPAPQPRTTTPPPRDRQPQGQGQRAPQAEDQSPPQPKEEAAPQP